MRHNYDSDELSMILSEIEPPWPPSDEEIAEMKESMDAYDSLKLDDKIQAELWRESLPSIPTPADLNPNLK